MIVHYSGQYAVGNFISDSGSRSSSVFTKALDKKGRIKGGRAARADNVERQRKKGATRRPGQRKDRQLKLPIMRIFNSTRADYLFLFLVALSPATAREKKNGPL